MSWSLTNQGFIMGHFSESFEVKCFCLFLNRKRIFFLRLFSLVHLWHDVVCNRSGKLRMFEPWREYHTKGKVPRR